MLVLSKEAWGISSESGMSSECSNSISSSNADEVGDDEEDKVEEETLGNCVKLEVMMEINFNCVTTSAYVSREKTKK